MAKNTALVSSPDVSPATFTADQIALMKRTVCQGATDDEFKLFLSQCQRTQLDPFSRQIYALKIDGKLSTQVSIDGFRLIAERSGQYAGQLGPFWCGEDGVWCDVWVGDSAPVAARVAVLRHDFKEPCWGVARFKSYGRNSPIWKRYPDVMLAKCAEALCLRRGFPLSLSGLYTEDEMAQAQPDTAPPAPFAKTPTPVVVEVPVVETPVTVEVPVVVVPDTDTDEGVYVQQIEEKSGETNGKPWQRFEITFSDGQTPSTFDAELALRAEDAQTRGAAVSYTTRSKGKYLNLDTLEISGGA